MSATKFLDSLMKVRWMQGWMCPVPWGWAQRVSNDSKQDRSQLPGKSTSGPKLTFTIHTQVCYDCTPEFGPLYRWKKDAEESELGWLRCDDDIGLSNPSIFMIGWFSRRIALYITTTDDETTSTINGTIFKDFECLPSQFYDSCIWAACKLGTFRNSISCANVCINNYFLYLNRSCPCGQKSVSDGALTWKRWCHDACSGYRKRSFVQK